MADGGEISSDEEEGERAQRQRKWLHLRLEDLGGLDDATARKVLADHGRLVIHLARRYRLPTRVHGPASLDDMIATGHAVLLQCWVRYDPTRGAKFSTWASLILRRTFAALAREARGHTVTDQERAIAGLDQRFVPSPLSLDEPSRLDNGTEESGVTIADRIALYTNVEQDQPEREVSRQQIRTWLYSRIETVLTDREREVMRALLAGANGVEVGERCGITRQRVDQLWQRAVEKLRYAAWDDGIIEGPEPTRGSFSPDTAHAMLAFLKSA